MMHRAFLTAVAKELETNTAPKKRRNQGIPLFPVLG